MAGPSRDGLNRQPGAGGERMGRGRERKVADRLDGSAEYRTDWRPARCERKLGEVVVDDNGGWWLEVLCKTCSRRLGRRTTHLLPLDRERLKEARA